MDYLCLTGAVTALANAVSEGLDAAELGLLASIFVQLGDTLATISLLKGLSEDKGGVGTDGSSGFCG